MVVRLVSELANDDKSDAYFTYTGRNLLSEQQLEDLKFSTEDTRRGKIPGCNSNWDLGEQQEWADSWVEDYELPDEEVIWEPISDVAKEIMLAYPDECLVIDAYHAPHQ